MSKRTLLLAVAALAGMATVSAAPFTNGGFESTNCALTTCTFGGPFATPGVTLTGWTIATGLPGSADVDIVNNSYWAAYSGTYSIDLNGLSQGGLQQTFDTVAGHTYQFGYAFTGNPDAPSGLRSGSYTITGGYSGTFTANSASITDRTTVSGMNWQNVTLSFVAAGSSTTLTFLSTTAGNKGPVIDNISVTDLSATPEPASLLFVGAGILLVGLKRFRKA